MADTVAATPAPKSEFITNYGWIIAVLIVVIACIISNFGLNMQKLALNVTTDRRKQLMMWLLGISCVVIGSLGDFFGLAFGAQSIVAPLGSMTVVSNIFLAPIMQGEVVTRADVIYTGIIVFGCVVTVAFASHKQAEFTIDELYSFFSTNKFRLYITVIIGILSSVSYWVWNIEQKEKLYGQNHRFYQKWQKFHRFSYAAMSGVAGAQSVLFAKLLVELIKNTFAPGSTKNMFADPYSYMVIMAMALSIFLQIYWLNCGLARWDALYNVPVFQSFWISFSEISGGIVYGEFNDFSFFQGFMFLAGSMATVYGVYMLSQVSLQY
jgi:uncharacterized membrane protein